MKEAKILLQESRARAEDLQRQSAEKSDQINEQSKVIEQLRETRQEKDEATQEVGVLISHQFRCAWCDWRPAVIAPDNCFHCSIVQVNRLVKAIKNLEDEKQQLEMQQESDTNRARAETAAVVADKDKALELANVAELRTSLLEVRVAELQAALSAAVANTGVSEEAASLVETNRTQLESVSQERDAFRQDRDEARTRLNEMEAQMAERNNDFDEVLRARDAYKSVLDTQEVELESKVDELGVMKSKCTTLNARLTEEMAGCIDASNELQDVRADRDMYSAKLSELTTLGTENSSAFDEIKVSVLPNRTHS
jgi:chromosome segregation ATPase